MKLEELLKKSIGKWVNIDYVVNEVGNVGRVNGILREVNEDFIKVEGIFVQYLNRKTCSIEGISMRIEA